MKIVFTSYASAPEFSEPEKWLQRLAGYTGILEILAKDHEVYGIEKINYEGVHLHNGVTYHFISQQKKIVHFPKKIHQLIKKINPDVVFINGFIFPLQIVQLRFALKKNAKILLFHRADKPFTGIKKMLQKIADRFIDGYLFSTEEFGKIWMDEGIISHMNKVQVVMHASSSFFYQNRLSSRSLLAIDGSPVFLWVGRLEANKDPITVTKAFIEYTKIQSRAKLYMVYHQDELLSEIQNLINQNPQVKGNIELVGKKSHDELPDWYNSADFIISGSHYEGGGVAISEAMSCGCIPILTNIPSFRKMTGPGKCGMLYNPGDVNELLACLIKTKDVDIEKEKDKVLEQFRDELSFEAIGIKINKIISESA